jgi:hypothetical protein
VIFRARHLQEDRLFECYLSEQGGEPIEPPAAEHLTDCLGCRARYGDLRRFMDGLRLEADAELDEIFPSERSRAQRQHISRRIEQLGRHARVITFPAHRSAEKTPPASRSRSFAVPHWVGAAAAASLVIGIGAGSLYHARASATPPQTVAMSAIPVSADAAVPAVVTDVNEQFLSELERALERPHTRELVALDELTPHVREVRVQLR